MRNTLLLAFITLFFGGCIGQTTLNDTVGQLTKRDYQTKEYRASYSSLFKITVDTLSDEKYIIKYTDERQGIITAQKMKDNMIIDINALIKSTQRGSSLRFNASMSTVNFLGGRNATIEDKDYYKYLFTKVEKSIFLDKNLYSSSSNYRPGASGRGVESYEYDYKYNTVENYDSPNLNQYYAY